MSFACGNKEWAVAVERRARSGERIPHHLLRIAGEALGRTIERRVPACRPDHADLAAGDDSFAQTDDEMVPL